MQDLTSPAALRELARIAHDALVGRYAVKLVHQAGWTKPPNWPLPIKRVPDGAPQMYRPLPILEYVDWALDRQEKWSETSREWSDLV